MKIYYWTRERERVTRTRHDKAYLLVGYLSARILFLKMKRRAGRPRASLWASSRSTSSGFSMVKPLAASAVVT